MFWRAYGHALSDFSQTATDVGVISRCWSEPASDKEKSNFYFSNLKWLLLPRSVWTFINETICVCRSRLTIPAIVAYLILILSRKAALSYFAVYLAAWWVGSYFSALNTNPSISKAAFILWSVSTQTSDEIQVESTCCGLCSEYCVCCLFISSGNNRNSYVSR